MKRFLSILLSVILIISMAACSNNTEPKQLNPPGSNGPSKPTSTEPPVLMIDDRSGNSIKANTGTYTWTYDNGDGTETGVCADSSHPLEWQEFLVPMTTINDTVELKFEAPPHEYMVSHQSQESSITVVCQIQLSIKGKRGSGILNLRRQPVRYGNFIPSLRF